MAGYSESNVERREWLRKLALETINLAKDPLSATPQPAKSTPRPSLNSIGAGIKPRHLELHQEFPNRAIQYLILATES
ncbi:hypothetical protein M427DRAFT_38155 [Gonapodya prolifera JEL478]|uniref:Uncharacterized protein n=1 Tax=Gonapodya prolifera (strain JEL478) TaxID=1344416 RepID=A0A139A050_GONPJ|nr:hypothetical protein M427DRAFT_38155 [Gonapodya prolifera JEL478]|eukprot:KXS09915.1 hypothetical protein M427DRAFT_38155 [Gonapodya prolifera JEL478]